MRSHGRIDRCFPCSTARRHGRRHEDPLASSSSALPPCWDWRGSSWPASARPGRHAGDGARARAPDLRRGRRAQGLLHAHRRGRVDRHQRRLLQGSGGGRARRQARRQVPAVPPGERFSALQSGEIDVLSRNVAMTSSRDTELGIRFPGVLVFDGPGLHGAQVARRRQRAGVVGDAHLRGGRDRRRAGHRRLLRRR